MKKLLNILFTITILPLLLVSCGTTNNGSNNNPSENEGENIEDENDYVESDIEDALLYSHNRLKNADMSFDFSFSSANKRTSYKKNINPGEKESFEDNGDGTYTYEYYFSSEDEPTTYYSPATFFSSTTNTLNKMRQDAFAIVDYSVANISKLDTLVEDADNQEYVLSYDYEHDSVSVFYHQWGKKTYVEVYYDEDDYEVVHMLQTYVAYEDKTYVPQEADFAYYEIYYTPDHYYSYTDHFIYNAEKIHNYNTATARKINGEWRGFSTSFMDDNVILTKNGEYGANGGPDQVLTCAFLFEKDGEYFLNLDIVEPLRANGDSIIVPSGLDWTAREDDIVGLKKSGLRGEWFSFSFDEFGMNISLERFTSLDKLHVKIEDPMEINYGKDTFNDPSSMHFVFDDEEDYLLTTTGKKISYKFGYNPIDGYIKFDETSGMYVDENENQHTEEDMKNKQTVFFNDCNSYISNGKMDSALVMAIGSGNTNPDNFISEIYAIQAFLEAYDLELRGDSKTVFNKLLDLMKYNDIYTSQLFEKLYGIEYSAENIILLSNNLMAEVEGNKLKMANMTKGMTSVSLASLPPVPESEESIMPTLNLESGEIVVNKNRIDLSNLKISIERSILLHDKEKYILKLLVNNTLYKEDIEDIFQMATYQKAKMSFVFEEGKTILPLPYEYSSYTYKLRLYRVRDNKYYPASKDLVIPIADFKEFNTTIAAPEFGGSYECNYKKEGTNTLLVNAKFIDEIGPSIYTSLEVIDGEVFVPNNYTLEDLMNTITILDNYDEFLTKEDLLIRANNQFLIYYLNKKDPLIDQATYYFIGEDASGNYGELVLKVNLINEN